MEKQKAEGEREGGRRRGGREAGERDNKVTGESRGGGRERKQGEKDGAPA